MNEILTAYETRIGTQLSVTRVSTAELKARVDKNPADFAWLLLLYSEGYANVEKAGAMAMELFPGWNPRKVVDVLAGMAT